MRRREEISRLFEHGRRAADATLTLLGAPAQGWAGPARMGVAAAGRLGNAVTRNRVKRLCREAFRLVRAEMPAGWDFVMVPRRSRGLTLEGLVKSLRRLGGKMGEKPERLTAENAENAEKKRGTRTE